MHGGGRGLVCVCMYVWMDGLGRKGWTWRCGFHRERREVGKEKLQDRDGCVLCSLRQGTRLRHRRASRAGSFRASAPGCTASCGSLLVR